MWSITARATVAGLLGDRDRLIDRYAIHSEDIDWSWRSREQAAAMHPLEVAADAVGVHAERRRQLLGGGGAAQLAERREQTRPRRLSEQPLPLRRFHAAQFCTSRLCKATDSLLRFCKRSLCKSIDPSRRCE